MSRFDPIPRHDPPRTEENKRDILTNPMLWFEKGSILYKEAIRLAESLDNGEESTDTIVGKPISRTGMTSDRYRGEREIVSGMLYAMAVECWLKGILVSGINSGWTSSLNELNEYASSFVEDIMCSGSGSISPDFFVSLYEKALETDKGTNLQNSIRNQIAEETSKRYELWNKNKNHRLVDLADQIGIKKYAKRHDFDYLEFLSSAIFEGRYPFHNAPEKHYPWHGIAYAPDRWDSLNEAISKCYEEVVLGSGK